MARRNVLIRMGIGLALSLLANLTYICTLFFRKMAIENPWKEGSLPYWAGRLVWMDLFLLPFPCNHNS